MEKAEILWIYKEEVRKYGNIETTIEAGAYRCWNEYNIARAFNLGQGTIKDMMDFIHGNKDNWIFIDILNKKVYNTQSKVDFDVVSLNRSKWEN